MGVHQSMRGPIRCGSLGRVQTVHVPRNRCFAETQVPAPRSRWRIWLLQSGQKQRRHLRDYSDILALSVCSSVGWPTLVALKYRLSMRHDGLVAQKSRSFVSGEERHTKVLHKAPIQNFVCKRDNLGQCACRHIVMQTSSVTATWKKYRICVWSTS